jgi:hypothetical protein
LITCKYVCVAGEISNSDRILQRDGDTVEPVIFPCTDVSRAWEIMDIMNNIEVRLMFEQGAKDVMILGGGGEKTGGWRKLHKEELM